MPFRSGRARTFLAVAAPCFLAVACTPAPNDPPPTNGTSPTQGTTASQSPCTLTMDSGSGVRYEAGAPGSRWWVSYTTLTNTCTEPITLVGLATIPARTTVGGETPMTWTSQARIRVLPKGEVPTLFFKDGAFPLRQLKDAKVPPSETVQIVGEVQMPKSVKPAPVPPVDLTYRVGQVDRTSVLPLDLKMCNCAMPPSP